MLLAWLALLGTVDVPASRGDWLALRREVYEPVRTQLIVTAPGLPTKESLGLILSYWRGRE
jgi:hypothetical protein